MRRLYALLLAIAALAGAPALAASDTHSERFVSGVPLERVEGIATYGPFRVIDASHAALVGITDEATPRQFAAMLRDYPGLQVLDLIECPGTFDDHANLALGRMIRRSGLATYVPSNGSVRSGAVELFIAGAHRDIADGARFAVHAWEDDTGVQATDLPADAPENAKYLAYYQEMGMPAERAKAFYALTNSVPNQQALWLTAAQMRGWVTTDDPAAPAQPQLAYLDLGGLLH